MDLPSTSTATSDESTVHVKTNDEIIHDVATTFWIVFIFYVFASVAWITYCIISYRRDLEKLKLSAEKNSIARYLELRIPIFFTLKKTEGEGFLKPTILWISRIYVVILKFLMMLHEVVLDDVQEDNNHHGILNYGALSGQGWNTSLHLARHIFKCIVLWRLIETFIGVPIKIKTAVLRLTVTQILFQMCSF
ncbi:hypothetical protein RB195_020873 [Necator americanus]|uniref:Bestrophin homolog n=1 Tax=Necator americanus TaxID=51031 RepID=A0ABR1CKZ5_NECAM